MRLFLQAKRPNILLPYEENGSSGILGEQVEFSTQSDTVSVVSAESVDSSDIWADRTFGPCRCCCRPYGGQTGFHAAGLRPP